jgi:hypothetical protein
MCDVCDFNLMEVLTNGDRWLAISVGPYAFSLLYGSLLKIPTSPTNKR